MVAAGCELRARFTGYESQALSFDFIMVAAGCELRARFTGYESQALSFDFIMVAAGRRGKCRERRVGRRRFGGCKRVAASCEARVW
jgi:hypothetical protein